MYTLQDARTEIDAVARHAATLCDHVAILVDRQSMDTHALDARLERFKLEISQMIDAKLSEAQHSLLAGQQAFEDSGTSAIADLGSTMKRLTPDPAEDAVRDRDAPFMHPMLLRALYPDAHADAVVEKLMATLVAGDA